MRSELVSILHPELNQKQQGFCLSAQTKSIPEIFPISYWFSKESNFILYSFKDDAIINMTIIRKTFSDLNVLIGNIAFSC